MEDLLEHAIRHRQMLSHVLDVSTEESSEGELAAMVSYAIAFPDGFMALVDTYDVKRYFAFRQILSERFWLFSFSFAVLSINIFVRLFVIVIVIVSISFGFELCSFRFRTTFSNSVHSPPYYAEQTADPEESYLCAILCRPSTFSIYLSLSLSYYELRFVLSKVIVIIEVFPTAEIQNKSHSQFKTYRQLAIRKQQQ